MLRAHYHMSPCLSVVPPPGRGFFLARNIACLVLPPRQCWNQEAEFIGAGALNPAIEAGRRDRGTSFEARRFISHVSFIRTRRTAHEAEAI